MVAVIYFYFSVMQYRKKNVESTSPNVNDTVLKTLQQVTPKPKISKSSISNTSEEKIILYHDKREKNNSYCG